MSKIGKPSLIKPQSWNNIINSTPNILPHRGSQESLFVAKEIISGFTGIHNKAQHAEKGVNQKLWSAEYFTFIR